MGTSVFWQGGERLSRRRRPWRTTALLALLVLAVVGALAWRVARVTQPDPPDILTRELAHLKTLGYALRLHAADHGGRFPQTLAGITWRQTDPVLAEPGLPAAVGLFHDAATDRPRRWLYYTGHSLDDPPETILAASPVPVGRAQDRRLIVRLNNVAEILPESDFARQIANQGEPAP